MLVVMEYKKTTIIGLTLLVLNVVTAELNIITRSQWTAKNSTGPITSLELPLKRIVICHTASGNCSTQDACTQRVQMIQEYHMKFSKFSDIAYNFLIGNDGNIYEGRGWHLQGAFVKGFNAGSLGIAFIGTFDTETPSDAALQASQLLLDFAHQSGKVEENFKLIGHRQLAPTNSPGNALYEIIKKWKHWTEIALD